MAGMLGMAAASSAEALRRTTERRPDVTLVDFEGGGGSGVVRGRGRDGLAGAAPIVVGDGVDARVGGDAARHTLLRDAIPVLVARVDEVAAAVDHADQHAVFRKHLKGRTED